MLYSCKPLFDRIKAELKEEIAGFPDAPRVCVVTSGNDEPSQRYVRNKLRDFAELGINGGELRVDNSMQLMYFLANNAREYDGVIVQRPIEVLGGTHKEMVKKVAEKMPSEVDIDGVVPGSGFMPPSVRGLDILLKEWGYDPSGKTAVVIGRGEVGKPVAEYLLGRDATVTICHSKTTMVDRIITYRNSDIVVGAAGLKLPMFPVTRKYDGVIIDYGITKNADTGMLHGDFDSDCAEACRYQTSVPGGMGLMVRAGLLLNIIDAYKTRRGIE